MIDINIIKADGKFYSVKCKLEFSNENEKLITNVFILNVDLVKLDGISSYVKIKNIFKCSDGRELFNKVKYKGIYNALIKKLIQKFRMNILNI